MLATIILKWYKNTSLIIVTSLVLFFVCNLIIELVFHVSTSESPDQSILSRNLEKINQIYPSKTKIEVESILKESWSNKFFYEPFTGFREATRIGNFVSVMEPGFRLSQDQGPWPPNSENLNVFLFGGSTAFNYGLPDDETIASYLQKGLNENSRRKVAIYNFGRAYYYSSQERILFEQLLTKYNPPDIVIFIDGLNDFVYPKDEPAYTDVFKNYFSGTITSTRFLLSELFVRTPVGRLLKRKMIDQAKEVSSVNAESYYKDEKIIDEIVKRYRANKKIIEVLAEEYRIQPIFVLQPVPVYKPNENQLPITAATLKNVFYAKYGYQQLQMLYEKGELGGNTFWAADLQSQLSGELYVDSVHYSAKMSKAMADQMVNFIIKKHFIK